jgi:hypothetical protein
MQAHGEVRKGPIAGGSKSEREAVLLATDSGQFMLRRQGGNPFHDPVLEALVGKVIDCEGTLHGYAFIMSKWTESDK